MPHAPRADAPIVVFDFDGTIADSLDLAIQQYNRVAPFLRTKRVARGDLARLRKLDAKAAMRESGVSLWKVPLLVSAIRISMRDHVDSVEPCVGIVAAVRELHAAGVRCSILSTNSTRNIERFLDRHDLRVFEHVVGSASMFGKAREIRKLAARAGYDPARIRYVGDEVRDLQAARAAGVRSIAVSWGYADRDALAKHAPTHVIDRPEELLPIIRGS